MKKILISGASRGIGLAIAKIFYKNNYQVIICSHNAEKLAKCKEEMPLLQTFVCDMTNKEAIYFFAETINKTFGSLDIIVNNMGIYTKGNICQDSEILFEKLMQSNLYSAYYLTKALLPLMIAQKKGTIFNICSTSSIEIKIESSFYCISKHALYAFGKALKVEMKEHNINVINILPGAVKTDSWDGIDMPSEYFMPVEDIAEVIFEAYRLSEKTILEDIILRPKL